MWEEHPEHQKQQARFVGWIVAGVIALYLVYAVVHHDWDLFRGVCIFVGGVILALGLIVGCVWLLVKILTKRRADATKKENDHTAKPTEAP
jgi:protein-S-isoprenylcysteine O-methyltransferase Ste14